MGTFAAGSQISAALHTAIALKRFNISLPGGCQSVFISPFEPFLMLPAAKTGWSLQHLPMHGATGGGTPRVGAHFGGGTTLPGRE